MFVLYVLDGCPYCEKALEILKQHKLKYEKVVVPQEEEKKKLYKKKCEMTTFPMIFVETNEKNQYIKVGGSNDLETYIQECQRLQSSPYSMNLIYSIYNSLFNKK
jgi:glutaredoxin